MNRFLFNNGVLEEFLRNRTNRALREADGLHDEKFASETVEKIAEEFCNRYSLQTPTLQEPERSPDIKPVKATKQSFFPKKQYTVDAKEVTFKITYMGSLELFNHSPDIFTSNSLEGFVTGNQVCFQRIVDISQDVSVLQQQFKDWEWELKSKLDTINKQVNSYHEVLRQKIKYIVEQKKAVYDTIQADRAKFM